MDFLLLALYNLAAVGVAVAGVWLERRGRRRWGIALLLVALLMILNLFVGGALLFVPFIIALYGVLLGGPIAAVWLVIRWLRRAGRHDRTTGEVPKR